MKNDRGVIAVLVLWILAVLSILSVGLGRQASIEMSLLKQEIRNFKGKYLGWAGVVYALDRMAQDYKDDTTKQFDTLYQCGIRLGDKTPQELLGDIPVGEGLMDIGYTADLDGTGAQFHYGLRDEESKININALTLETRDVLGQLIVMAGFDETQAGTIVFSVLDWKDQDNVLSQSELGAEDGYYMGLERPYHCKNRPFESVEELLLVRGVTPEVFAAIKDFITIYPRQGNFVINFDTASPTVLRALGYSITLYSQTSSQVADSVVDSIIAYRRGADGRSMTADDRQLQPAELPFSQEEQVVFLNMLTFRTPVSNHFSVRVRPKAEKGAPPDRGGPEVQAVVSRPETMFFHWQRM